MSFKNCIEVSITVLITADDSVGFGLVERKLFTAGTPEAVVLPQRGGPKAVHQAACSLLHAVDVLVFDKNLNLQAQQYVILGILSGQS